MPIQCPTCSRINPASAAYCYYDGRALGQPGANGSLGLGVLSFRSPFCFSDGQLCENYNQLALACDRKWSEARGHLVNGIWESFFTSIGRMDLVAVARQAAREADPDAGLSYLLERLPADADALRPPKLALLTPAVNLGALEPGKDHKFELVIENQGMLVLRGMVMTDCDWLFFGERQGNTLTKLFQTRDSYNLSIRVLGNKLRAGLKPLEGQIVLDTNGGRQKITVRAAVPIKPFPKGEAGKNVLAGARTPRELAVKAKAHPQEAAVLFEQGTVKAWYESNGWAYPVQGTHGKGKGVVQQFFEALGLTKPPHLEISTQRIECHGEPGQCLTRKVTIKTAESKFVTAEAQTNQDWVKIEPAKSQGNSVTIPLRIEIPPKPGETLRAEVLFQGNGQQQFLVPVTLTVAGKPKLRSKKEEPDSDEPAPFWMDRRLQWIGAGVGLLLVVVLALVLTGRGRGRVEPPPVVIEVPPEPPVPPKVEAAWWDGVPNSNFAAATAKLMEAAPGNQPLFERLALKSDVERYKGYEQLVAKLPELARNPKAREPLGRFVAECLVHEPSELNIAPLRRGLANQFPGDGIEFPPEEKGEELERAAFWLQVVFDALTNKAVRPDRSRTLVNELAGVFGFGLDTTVPPAELKAQTEKLLAERCYQNTLPTAVKSVDQALTIRGLLLARFPQQLPAEFRDQVDVDLLGIGLSRGNDLWPKLEPIFKTCVESNNVNIGVKLADLYEKVNPDLAPKMEALLAVKWKVVSNPNLAHAARVAALRKSLVADPAITKIARAERLTQLQKLIGKTLTEVKPGQQRETALLQDSVRLAQVSAMGAILFSKEGELERFDALYSTTPTLAQAKPAKDPGEKAKPAVGKGVITVDAGAWTGQEELTTTSERDPRRGAFRKMYSVSMHAGQFYSIDMRSTNLNAYLRLESPTGVQLAVQSGFPNAHMNFSPQADGIYRLVASTSGKDAVGPFTLQIQQIGGGFGMPGMHFPIGVRPRRFGPGPFGPAGPFGPGMPILPGQPVQQEAPPVVEKKESPLNKSDLADLGNNKSTVRIAAFNNLVGSITNDVAYHQAQKLVRYMLLTAGQGAELEAVTDKLDSLAKCRFLLQALADLLLNEGVTQQKTEAIVGGVLGQQLRFAKDEDWRSACRKLLLRRALELTGSTTQEADTAAAFLRDLYKEQGLAFGLENPEFLAETQLAGALESLIKHVAAQTAREGLAAPDREYLEQIGRQLRVAQFVADNDLERVVLLQRIWLKVLVLTLQKQEPAQAKTMLEMQQELEAQDRGSRNLLEQLRSGEEKILRVWSLATRLSGK